MSSRYRRRNVNAAMKQKGTVPPWAKLNKMRRDAIDALLLANGIESTGNLVKDRAALNKARG